MISIGSVIFSINVNSSEIDTEGGDCYQYLNGYESSNKLLEDIENNNEKKIGKINYQVVSIFDESDPEEDNWLFRWVNRLHIKTKIPVIKNDLLFKEGDRLDTNLISASERILNTRRYLNETSITMDNPCEEEVDVSVKVQDVWTLKPKASFSLSGGESKSSLGLDDSNFLGTGKSVLFKTFSDSERSGEIYRYFDPNTGAYNSTLLLSYAKNKDGKRVDSELIRPFLDFSTSWSAGIGYSNFIRNGTLYDAGEDAEVFGQETTATSFYAGYRINEYIPNEDANSASRILLGVTKTEDHFFNPYFDSVESTEFLNTAEILPRNRVFNTFWAEYQRSDDGYIKTSNVQQINRAEHINLGRQARIRIGYSPTSIKKNAKDESALLLDASYSQGTLISNDHLLIYDLGFSSYYSDGGLLNGVLQGEVSYHWKNIKRGQFYVGAKGKKGYRRFKDQPLELGDEDGMRGYPVHYQAGDRNFMLSLEQRFFGQKEWFSLFYTGAVVFFDVGRAWGKTSVIQSEPGWLKDVGIGLRLSGTRTGNRSEGRHTILHIDLVAPLDGSNDLDKYQWRVKTEKHF